MGYHFSDIVKAHSASALKTVRNGITTYFLKLDGADKFVRVSRDNYDYAKSLMKRWDSLLTEIDRNNTIRHYTSLRR